MVKPVALRNKTLLAASNRTDKRAFPFVDITVHLQILALSEPLATPGEQAFKRLGAQVNVHVMAQTIFTSENLLTAQVLTFMEQRRFLR